MDLITREEARQQGLSRYLTGKPCPKGHVAERNVNGAGCVQCSEERYALARETTKAKREMIVRPDGYISRADAHTDGLAFFFTGAPCIRGHICQRRVSNKACLECTKEDKAEFTEAAQDKRRAATVIVRPEAIVSLEDARRQNLIRYYTGKACKHGHFAERYVVNRECVECRLIAYKDDLVKNPTKHQEYSSKRYIKKVENGIPELERIAHYLRSRTYYALKTKKRMVKIGSAVRDLGCPLEFFQIFIEVQFKDGMSWDNWGDVWELDHVKPFYTFDLTKREEFLEACHFDNFQPLFIAEHQAKSVAELRARAAERRSRKTATAVI